MIVRFLVGREVPHQEAQSWRLGIAIDKEVRGDSLELFAVPSNTKNLWIGRGVGGCYIVR